MKTERMVLVSAVLLCASLLAVAQEKPPVSEVLRWFPDGTYYEFGHYHQAALLKTEAYAGFKVLFDEAGDDIFGTAPPLPEKLNEAVAYISFARSASIGLLDESKALQAKIRDIRKSNEKLTNEERKHVGKLSEKFAQLQETNRLWVYNVPGVEELVQAVVKTGEMVKTGKRLFKRPIYTLHSGDKRTGSKTQAEYYAYSTGTNELLVTRNIEALKEMTKSGMGQQGSLVDNQEYVACFDYLVDRGQTWKVEPVRLRKKLEIEKMRKDGATDEKILAAQDKLEKEVVYDMVNITVSDEVKMQSLKLYPNEDIAKEEYRKISGELKKAGESLKGARKEIAKETKDKELTEQEQRMVRTAMGFAGNILNNNETIIEGNLVKTTITFGKKQLKTLGMLMNFAKMMEEKEAKKEKRKAEKEDK